MRLHDVWFGAIAVLFIGYFFLEGFDFGVGILTRVLARDEVERRVLIDSIGPVWDGNEVWLITAGGAMFAAFPEWYASLFSGFYLPLLLILVALIVRGVAFEYRGKREETRWRSRWDLALFWGSLVPAVLWGVAIANIVRGVKLDSGHLYAGSFWALLNPYALLGGVTGLAVFLVHGAIYLALKTTGEVRERAHRFVGRAGPFAAVLAVIFLGLSVRYATHTAPMVVLAGLGVLGGVAALGADRIRREGWAFAFSGAAIVLGVGSLFAALYPHVLPATVEANGLTVSNASATAKTLGIMTWVAVVFLPLVLLYQGWTYWVFRRRVGVQDMQG